jgi:hypothetical protein
LNRGFEGVACSSDAIFAILQSPFDDSSFVPIVEFNPKTEQVSSVRRYPMSTEKIGDLAKFEMNLLTIEQNSQVGASAQKWLYAVNPYARVLPMEKKFILDLAKLGFSEFEKLEGLTVLGKIESLKSFLPKGQEEDFIWIAVVNDNDFGLPGKVDAATGELIPNSQAKTVLGLIPVPLKSFN